MSYKQLNAEQRYTIDVLLQKKKTKKEIADILGVHFSTITREIERNKMDNGTYRYDVAQKKAESRFRVPPRGNRIPPHIWLIIDDFIIKNQWSPAQIAGALKKNGDFTVSKQAIYNHIHADKTGKLALHCRDKAHHKSHKKEVRITKAPAIKDRVSIHERPDITGEFGNWEMDTIVDGNGNAILTLVEKKTSFMLMEKLKNGRKAHDLALVVYRLLLPYKGKGVKSITTDNGSEFAEHKLIAKKLNTTVYFTDAYSSWQKGAIENMNRLVRQYIPKKTDFSSISQKKLTLIRCKLNKRPREKLNFCTPFDVFFNYFN